MAGKGKRSYGSQGKEPKPRPPGAPVNAEPAAPARGAFARRGQRQAVAGAASPSLAQLEPGLPQAASADRITEQLAGKWTESRSS